MNGKLSPGTVNQMGHVRCPQCAEIPPVGPLTVIVIIIHVDNLIPATAKRIWRAQRIMCMQSHTQL